MALSDDQADEFGFSADVAAIAEDMLTVCESNSGPIALH